jgi:hypothetical protein
MSSSILIFPLSDQCVSAPTKGGEQNEEAAESKQKQAEDQAWPELSAHHSREAGGTE